ncbi:MAG: SpoIIE family protein phosphatase [Lentisphaerota bacterium]
MKKLKVKYGLAFRLCAFVVAFVVVLIFFILSYNYFATRNKIIDNTRNNIEIITSLLFSKIDYMISSAEKRTTYIANVLNNQEFSIDEFSTLLKKTVESDPFIHAIGLAFCPNMVFEKKSPTFIKYFYREGGTIKEGDENFDYTHKNWYKAALENDSGVWSKPYYGFPNNTLMISYSIPFYATQDEKRVTSGVVESEIWLEELMKSASKIKGLEDGYVFFIAMDDLFIVHNNQVEVTKLSSLPFRYDEEKSKAIFDGIKQGKDYYEMSYNMLINQEAAVYFSQFEKTQWSIGVMLPMGKEFSELNYFTTKLMIIGIAGCLIIIAFIIILINKITRPLYHLARANSFVGKGDFQAEIPRISSFDEIGVLTLSFEKMKRSLKKYVKNLEEATAAKKKIESDLAMARAIQQALLPLKFKIGNEFDLYASLTPALEVGGDLYDFFMLDKDHFCFAVGDVSGKGVPAALFMAIVKTLFRSKMNLMLNPSDVLNAMNADICTDNETSTFVTFFLAVMNIRTGVIEYSNAGHNFPLVLDNSSGKCSFLDHGRPQPPIGLVELQYTKHSIQLKHEDLILLYTDGVTEAKNANDQLYTNGKLAELLNSCKESDSETIVKCVLSSVHEFSKGVEQSDDITLLALKYK